MKISIAFNDFDLTESLVKKVEALWEVDIFNVKKLTEEEVVKTMPETEILICGTAGFSYIGKKTFDWLKNLKLISIFGVGYDWIDIEEANKRGIIVSAAIGGNSEAVAEHTWGMILNLWKRISEFERDARKNGENNVNNYQGLEVFGKTIGIIGLWEIGKRVARIAKAFNMRIIGTNKSGKLVDDVELVDLKYLLENSDVITLCLPLSLDTENLIGEEELKLMKNDVILVNSSREKLVDKKAILKTISEGKIFGYGIETEIFEPISIDDEYFDYPNILLTPHNAWNTKEMNENNISIIVKNVKAFLDNNPINVIKK